MAKGPLLQGLASTQAVFFVLLATALSGVVSDPGEHLPVEEQGLIRVPHQVAADPEIAEAEDDHESKTAEETTEEWPSTTQRLGRIADFFGNIKNKLTDAGAEAATAKMEVIASLRVGTPVKCRDTKEGIEELKRMLPDEMFPHVLKEVEWYKQWKTTTAKHTQEKKKNHERGAYMGAVVTHAQAQAEGPPEKFVYFVRPPSTSDCTVDGRLTAGSLKQARDMLEKFPQLSRAEVIITSPLARSLETALLVFQGHPAGNLSQIVLDPNLDEVGGVQVYKQGKGALFDMHREDVIPAYHLLWGDSNPHEIGFHTAEDMPQLRWKRFVKSLAQRPEKFIVVFTHAAMMETNLGEVPDDGKYVMRLLRDGNLIRVLPPGAALPTRSALVSPAKHTDKKATPHTGKDKTGAALSSSPTQKNQKGKPSQTPKNKKNGEQATLVATSKHKPDKGASEQPTAAAKKQKETSKKEVEGKKKPKLLLKH